MNMADVDETITPITKGDVADGNVDKVFRDGVHEPEPQAMTSLALVASRPQFTVTAQEMDGAKMLAGGGPFVPEYLRGDIGAAYAVIQIAKRYSKYDERTNSWVSFDPYAVAQNTYVVTSEGGRKQTIGHTSLFVGAILDAFVPWAKRMRYTYEGEGQSRRCTAVGWIKGDPEPFEYTTPPLSQITPKRSPLWESDPDRQLAYYARRVWAREHAAGVMLGIYDVDELEGDLSQRAHRIRDEGQIERLHERLAAAAANGGGGPSEGFSEGAAAALTNPAAAPEPAGEKKPRRGRAATPPARKLTSGQRKGEKRVAKKPQKAADARKRGKTPPNAPPPRPRKLPTNAGQYAVHVEAWLGELNTEEAIEARWRQEMKLRNVCGVVEEQRLVIRTAVEQRIAELREYIN